MIGSSLQKGQDGRYHFPGTLTTINKETRPEHFLTLQPIFKAVNGFKTLVLSPLPRYLWARCCPDPGHIINSESPSFATDMGRATTSLKNMIFMRKLKDVAVVNTVEALGIVGALDEDQILALWGETQSTRGRLLKSYWPLSLRKEPLALWKRGNCCPGTG